MEHFTIATVAEQSADFRRVLWTGQHTQLVIMTIPPGGEIGEEVHEENDQVLSFVSGVGKAVIEGSRKSLAPGDVVVVQSVPAYPGVEVSKHPVDHHRPRWCPSGRGLPYRADRCRGTCG